MAVHFSPTTVYSAVGGLGGWKVSSIPTLALEIADINSNEDDLTAKLAEIVQHNRILAYIMDSGHGIEQTMVSQLYSFQLD